MTENTAIIQIPLGFYRDVRLSQQSYMYMLKFSDTGWSRKITIETIDSFVVKH